MFGQGNRGDTGDLYPNGTNRQVGKMTKPPRNLPDGSAKGKWSGVTINVSGTPGADSMMVRPTVRLPCRASKLPVDVVVAPATTTSRRRAVAELIWGTL